MPKAHAKEAALGEKLNALNQREEAIAQREAQLQQRELAIPRREEAVAQRETTLLPREERLNSLRPAIKHYDLFPPKRNPDTAPITMVELKGLVRIWKLHNQRNFWRNPVANIKLRDIIHLLVVTTFIRRFVYRRIVLLDALLDALLDVPRTSVWVG